MSLLSILGVGVIMACLEILLAIIGGDGFGDIADGEFGEIGRVGTHIGDVSLLV